MAIGRKTAGPALPAAALLNLVNGWHKFARSAKKVGMLMPEFKHLNAIKLAQQLPLASHAKGKNVA